MCICLLICLSRGRSGGAVGADRADPGAASTRRRDGVQVGCDRGSRSVSRKARSADPEPKRQGRPSSLASGGLAPGVGTRPDRQPVGTPQLHFPLRGRCSGVLGNRRESLREDAGELRFIGDTRIRRHDLSSIETRAPLKCLTLFNGEGAPESVRQKVS